MAAPIQLLPYFARVCVGLQIAHAHTKVRADSIEMVVAYASVPRSRGGEEAAKQLSQAQLTRA